MTRLQGAVITRGNEDAAAMFTLLSFHMKDRIEYTNYDHPTQLHNSERSYDFIAVCNGDDIERVVSFYGERGVPVPFIINLVPPNERPRDFSGLYPEAEVKSIQMGNLDQMDATLELDAFKNLIDTLHSR